MKSPPYNLTQKGRAMELGIRQRILLLQVLPVEGVQITDLRIVKDLRFRVGFTEEEQERFGFVQEGNRLDWDPNADERVDIDIGPRAHVLIQDALKTLNEQRKLTLDHVELWDLFGCDED